MPEIYELTATSFSVLMPELIMVGFAVLVMMVDITIDHNSANQRKWLAWTALVGVVLTGVATALLWLRPDASFQGAAASDNFANAVRMIVLVATGLGILLSSGYIPKINKQEGEYYTLLLLCAAGMMMMGAATDLIVVFIALEVFSLALYILSGLHQTNARSTESAMKYFLLGAFASTFFAYGAALIYGATGSTQYAVIAEMLASGQGNMALLYPGMALLVVGFGFKISMVPFHMWTPDVYQGAPTPVTAFMSVGTKTAAFAAFIRVLLMALPTQHETWGGALAILAVLTMTLGNFAALRQVSLKRMLAYSSVAHAGYILVGVVSGTAAGANAALFYLFAYAFMNIGAFAVLIALENAQEGDVLANRAAGIAERWPWLALAMSIFMFSLSGIPPLAGFWGKFFLFKAAVDSGWAWLVMIAMLNSAVSAYYYLRVIVSMYFRESDSAAVTERAQWRLLDAGLVIASAFTILIGVLPNIWTGFFQSGM